MSTPATRKVWEQVTEYAALACAGSLAAVALLPGAGVPAWCEPVVVSVLALVAALAARSMSRSRSFAWWVVLLGAWLAGWSTWAERAGVWHPAVVVSWALGTIVLIVFGALVLARHLSAAPKAIEGGPSEEELARREKLAQWDHMWGEFGQEGVRTISVTDEPGGRVAVIELPRSGRVTMATLMACTPQMEVALRLREHAVTFSHLSHSGEIEVRLRERDVLGKAISLSPVHYPTTVSEPFAVGVGEDGSIRQISLSQVHMQLVGLTGAGKSNLINVLVAQMGRMVDTVIWCIDMKGGRVARPWIQPWADELTSEPVFDWVATTRQEAALMMSCFEAAITTRMNSGIGGSMITPSPEIPQIILLCDEAAGLIGQNKGPRRAEAERDGVWMNHQFAAKFQTITQMGRSEAGSVVIATQRGTNSMAGDGDIKANCNLRILLGTKDQAEARYVLADSVRAQKLAAAAANIKGAGVIALGADTTLLVKFFLHDHPKDPADPQGKKTLCQDSCVPECPIRKSAVETGRMRPRLDQMTAEGMGPDYASRWERAEELGLVRRSAVLQQARQSAPADSGGPSFEEVMAGSGMADPESRVDPRRLRMRQILAARGAQGASPKILLDQLGAEGKAPAREVLQRWLDADQVLGLCHSTPDWGRWQIGPAPKAA